MQTVEIEKACFPRWKACLFELEGMLSELKNIPFRKCLFIGRADG